MTIQFPAHTLETAPEEVRGAMDTMQKSMGFLPSMLAKFAEAPSLLMAYQAAAAFFEKSSLSSAERLVVVLTASYMHNCDFCMTAHSWGARRHGVDEGVLAPLRAGQPLSDPKLEALRRFVTAMVEKRGAVSDPDKDAFFDAGYGTRQALEVVLGLALKTMTNYTNALARTPPNPEFGDAVWHRRT
ncbi:carboxymuconolactone decarboxylase family protein [Luteimonas salinilitoris]|uniref:Carboxymuconolactone decarboxylase family protein n=1 Tax=Luteimonas salinilitoris TaxID=3237697 RepID=A0ABV4HVM4_9GAMM